MTPLPPFGPDPFARLQRGVLIHTLAPRPPVGTTPHAIVHEQDKLVLRYYAPPAGAPARPPVVIVPSLINRAWIVDLEPDRSLCAALATAGHPVYLVDWGTPGPEDADEDVGYVLDELLHRSVRRACRHARQPRALILGYCLGGTLSAMYAALHPEHVAGLAALNAPIRFSEGGRFRELVQDDRFSVDAVIDGDGLVPVTAMQPAFRLLDPVGSWTKFLAVEAAGDQPGKLARVMARERWLEENVPMAGAFAREFIRHAYQEDRLLDGTWTIRGKAVRLDTIAAPTLVVTCAKDFIAPPPSALPLADVVRNGESVTLDCGHIGVVVGSEGPRTFYPLLDRWLRKVSP